MALDAAGSGESDRGPLMAPQAFAETVFSIDTLLEYYNTVDQADASNAAIVGGSMGGTIAYCYVAHGKYALTAIFPALGTPDLTLLDDALLDCFDHGQSQAALPWTEEEVRAFAAAYSPSRYPERFLDTYVYAGNGALDDPGGGPEGPQALKAALAALGGDRFELYVDPDRGHERLPEYYENRFPRLAQILLGDAT